MSFILSTKRRSRSFSHNARHPRASRYPTIFLAPDVIATLIRMSAGNFRLLSRPLTQIERILKVNDFTSVSKEMVAAARDSLVIGQA